MPTYVIDGKSIRTDVELTDAELEELAGGAPAPQGNQFAEAIRRGISGGVGTVAGVSSVVGELLAPRQPGRTLGQAFTQGRQAVVDPLMRLFGSTGVQPTTTGGRIASAGVEAAVDPLSYLFPPLAAVRRMGIPAQIVARPAEQVVVGAGAETGGTAGEAAGAKVDSPTAGRVIGSLFGGVGAAYGTGTALKGGPLVGKAFDAAKTRWDKLRGMEPKDELLKDVDNRISNIFIAAAAADPKFMDALEAAAKAQQNVSIKAPGGQEVQLPLSSLLANNPVINNFIQGLSSKDPVFRAQYGAQFEQAKQALTANQYRLFGDPSKATIDLKPLDLSKPQARQIRSVDEQIADVANLPTIDANAFGARIEALINQKEKTARSNTKPLYEEAFNIANAKGVELPVNAVDDIYTFVTGAQGADIFKTFPTIYRKVQQRFRPTETEPSPILTAEGMPATPGGRQFAPATVQDLDSLKREINAQLRKTSNEAEIRLLSELKTRVSGHIDELDPEFVTAYRNADKAYFEQVGLPFDSATLRSIDRKKFVEQIVPAIIGNKSNVGEFLRAVGPDGEQVVRDAYFDNFVRAAVRNDAIDPKAANKWLSKNAGGLSLVPGLSDELRGLVGNTQALQARKAALNAEFERVAGEQLIRQQGFNDVQQLVTKMYSDPTFTQRLMSNSGIGQNKDAVNAVRSFMLDDIVRSGDPIGTLNDRTKAAAFNRVFGPTYAAKVADFAEVSSRLQRDLTDVSFRGETVPRTPIEQLTGIPPEMIISRIYNPVSGPVYAITSLLSKYWAGQTSKATEERLKALLLNPTDAVKVFNSVKAQADKFDPKKINDAIEVGKKYGIQWVADAVNDIQSGAARGAVQGAQEE